MVLLQKVFSVSAVRLSAVTMSISIFLFSLLSVLLTSQFPSYEQLVWSFKHLFSWFNVSFFPCAFVRTHCYRSYFFYSSFSFIMIILAILRALLAACFLLKHHIHGRDEPLPRRTECKFNISSPFCPACATLVGIYCPEEWGFVCLTNFMRKSISQRSFSDMQMGQGNLGQTNSFSFFSLLMINTLFSCFKQFQAHLNISGNHLWLFERV